MLCPQTPDSLTRSPRLLGQHSGAALFVREARSATPRSLLTLRALPPPPGLALSFDSAPRRALRTTATILRPPRTIPPPAERISDSAPVASPRAARAGAAAEFKPWHGWCVVRRVRSAAPCPARGLTGGQHGQSTHALPEVQAGVSRILFQVAQVRPGRVLHVYDVPSRLAATAGDGRSPSRPVRETAESASTEPQ